MLREVRVVIRIARNVFLDVDVRVRGLELLVEVVVAEVAEESDVERDRVLPAAARRACDNAECDYGRGRNGHRSEQSRPLPRTADKRPDVHLKPPPYCLRP